MIYLDNAATSFPKPEAVYTALDHFARHSLANPGRSGHKMAQAAEHAIADARHRFNRFFNGRHPERHESQQRTRGAWPVARRSRAQPT